MGSDGDTFKISHILNDFSIEHAASVPSVEAARQWCREDGATMFWPQPNGTITAANKYREPIHRIHAMGAPVYAASPQN